MRMTKNVYTRSPDGTPGSRRAVYRHVPSYDHTASPAPAEEFIADLLGPATAPSKMAAPIGSIDHDATCDGRTGIIMSTHAPEAGDSETHEATKWG